MNSISVIIPVYNAFSTIELCAESVLMQENVDVDLVIVDDGSDDGTAALVDCIAARDARVTAIHQDNGGRSRARNAGIRVAKGEWVSFVDADDWLFPGALAGMASVVCDAVDAVWAGYAKVTESRHAGRGVSEYYANGTWWDEVPYNSSVRAEIPIEQLLYATQRGLRVSSFPIEFDGTIERSACAKLYRRSVLEGNPEIRFSEGLRYGEDALFNVLFLAFSHKDVAMTSRIAYCYEMGSSGTCMQFTRADADALPVLCGEAKRVWSVVRDNIAFDVNNQAVSDYIGREIDGVIGRAARFGTWRKGQDVGLYPLANEDVMRAFRDYSPGSILEEVFHSVLLCLSGMGAYALSNELTRLAVMCNDSLRLCYGMVYRLLRSLSRKYA